MTKTLEIPKDLHEQLICQAATVSDKFADIIKNYKDYSIVSKRASATNFDYELIATANKDNYAGWRITSLAELFTDNMPDVALSFVLVIWSSVWLNKTCLMSLSKK